MFLLVYVMYKYITCTYVHIYNLNLLSLRVLLKLVSKKGKIWAYLFPSGPENSFKLANMYFPSVMFENALFDQHFKREWKM